MKHMLSLLMACLITLGAVPYAAASSGYADVSESAWYADAVEYVTDHGIMQGMGNGRFSPDTTLNRAQFVTLLHRMAGQSTGKDSDNVPGCCPRCLL